MHSKAHSVKEYLKELPEGRKEIISQLRQVVLDNLPEGFVEEMNYGMIGYVVPHSIFPDGYHTSPDKPLPFANIASQKNHIALYHMGLYSLPELLSWFKEEFPKHSKVKLDMGKSCLRFKKPEHIPLALIGQLMQKVSVQEWIEFYQKSVKR